MKKWIPLLLLILVVFAWSIVLKNEIIPVLIWWGILLLIGLLFWPLSAKIFSTFTDKGCLFSKIIGLAVTSYLLWLISFMKFLPVSMEACWGVVLASGIIVCLLFFRKSEDRKVILEDKNTAFWVLIGESLFLFSLCFWTYLRGFNPRIEGLEKFMDYGFVNSILRSQFIPPQDMWFAGESINYYYYGQYVTAFLTRLSGIKTEISYNIMMAALFAFSMGLCFTIVVNLLKGYGVKRNAPVIIGGLISASLVSLGGNLHSFFYGFLPKIFSGKDSYWFPDATRYIGYNPPTKDKTIHEFPVYSFVVSDLHAHVINMIFVLTLLGVLIAVFRKIINRMEEGWEDVNLLREIFIPEMILLGLFIGIFQMSNYWDFPIYLTVTLFTFLCAGIRQYGYTLKTAGVALIRFFTVILFSVIIALPFNLTFEKIATEIRITENRSMPHQLLVLWGYQLALSIIFLIFILYMEQNIRWKREKGKNRLQIRKEMTLLYRIKTILDKSPIEDIFAVILCISAIGLVIIPELVYVKDIYTGEHKRANTMFKLTYQAFIMFGLAAGYIFIRIRQLSWTNWKIKLSGIIAVAAVILPVIYPFYAIPSWYKNLDHKKYESLDGLAFLQKEYPDDYDLIMWLRDNVEGQPTVLEANGDSYTCYGRISMATGLPTIQGWYVHEWLWRNDNSVVSNRVDDVKTVYESDDTDATMEVLSRYQVRYIVIGELERKKFPEIKEDKLLSLGAVVFEKPTLKLVQVD